MMKMKYSIAIILSAATMLTTQTAFANLNQALTKTSNPTSIHVTHINTQGKVIDTDLFLQLGTRHSGICIPKDGGKAGTFKLLDDDMGLNGEAISQAGLLKYNCMLEIYQPLDKTIKPQTIDYDLLKNKDGTQFVDSNPNHQEIDLK